MAKKAKKAKTLTPTQAKSIVKAFDAEAKKIVKKMAKKTAAKKAPRKKTAAKRKSSERRKGRSAKQIAATEKMLAGLRASRAAGRKAKKTARAERNKVATRTLATSRVRAKRVTDAGIIRQRAEHSGGLVSTLPKESTVATRALQIRNTPNQHGKTRQKGHAPVSVLLRRAKLIELDILKAVARGDIDSEEPYVSKKDPEEIKRFLRNN